MTRTLRSPQIRKALSACRPALAVTGGLSLAINLLMFTGPLYMISVYDRVLASRHAGTLVALSLMALSSFLLYGALEFLRSRILIRSGAIFDRVLAGDLARTLFGSRESRPEADAQQALRDLDQVRDFLTGAAPMVLCDAPWTPLFVLLAWLLHPALGAAALVGIGGLCLLALLTEWLTRSLMAAANRPALEAAAVAAAALTGRELVVAHGMAGRLAARWADRRMAMLQALARASDRASLTTTVSRTYRVIFQSGILGLGAWLAIHQDIGIGAIFASNLLIGRALQPVDQAVQHWKGVIAARQALARLDGLFATAGMSADPMDLPAPKGLLFVENLAVRAPGAERPTLHSVNFRLSPGEMLTVVGASGAGKSTLLKALVHVWEAAAGTIRLDGATLDRYAGEKRGAAIGYLPQDVQLLAGTVAENIARFGVVDPEAVVDAARMAGVHDLILRLPLGYDTEIGPGGSALSGGQRQRIGLARALYGKPALLVLDEPNANLDLNGEAALQAALDAARAGGAAVIVSSHRQPLVAMADQLLVLSDGTQQMVGPRATVLEKIAPRPVRAA